MLNIFNRSLVSFGGALKRAPPSLIFKRTDTDFCADKIGNREVVGFGWNGSACYYDRWDYPFPSIRFREPSAEICALREKEKSDWKKLTICEKRDLYRYSFCQTYAEMMAPTGEWKWALGTSFWIVSIGISLVFSYYVFGVYPENPPTFEENRRRAQLRRMLILETDPIDGMCSKWDYKKDDWK